MHSYLNSAVAFGSLLQENPEAAHFYDSCTQAQRQAILAQLDLVPDMAAFVRDLPAAAL